MGTRYENHRPTIHEGINGRKIISISISEEHAACNTDAGELHTWGLGDDGKLGHEDVSNQVLPKLVDTLSGVFCKEVACGSHHTAVVTMDGKVYTFGQGRRGQLGNGEEENKHGPYLVMALEAVDIDHVQSGASYTMALSSTGYVFTGGDLGKLRFLRDGIHFVARKSMRKPWTCSRKL